MLLELLGPDRIVDPRKSAEVADYWNYGDPFETYPIDTGRLRRVAELAGERAGWGKPLPQGQGRGIAAHRSFLSYVATVVQVGVDDKGKLTIPRVDTAIDCGFHVNPERIRSQIEGAAVMGSLTNTAIPVSVRPCARSSDAAFAFAATRGSWPAATLFGSRSSSTDAGRGSITSSAVFCCRRSHVSRSESLRRLSNASELPPPGRTANEEAGGSGVDAPENRPPPRCCRKLQMGQN